MPASTGHWRRPCCQWWLWLWDLQGARRPRLQLLCSHKLRWQKLGHCQAWPLPKRKCNAIMTHEGDPILSITSPTKGSSTPNIAVLGLSCQPLNSWRAPSSTLRQGEVHFHWIKDRRKMAERREEKTPFLSSRSLKLESEENYKLLSRIMC